MKLFSQNLELRAIRSVAVANGEGSKLTVTNATTLSSLLLASLDESFFHYEPCKAAYKRILTVAKKRSRIVSYEDLIEDPALNEEYRDVLREYTKAPVSDPDKIPELIDALDSYRKTRALYYLAKDILDNLKKPEVEVEKLLDSATNQLTAARSKESLADTVLTVGKDANALDLLTQALSPEDESLLRTGFKEYDERNGGLPSEGVMLIAATTSGGKSAMRMNLMRNMYLLNSIDVGTVSLEMNAKKETRRLISSLTGIPFWKFIKKCLSEAEQKQCRIAWRKFHKHGVANDCRYGLLCPTRGLSIQQLLMLMKPYKYKALAIDYLSLLSGLEGQDQWKVLSEITRECKVFSAENHCLVILLAQLDSDDDRIRYSKGILENVDNAWIWNYSKQEQRDLRLLPIQQKKARDQELFGFDLAERFDVMSVYNQGDTMPSVVPSDGSRGHNSNQSNSGDDDSDVDVDSLSGSGVDYDVS